MELKQNPQADPLRRRPSLNASLCAESSYAPKRKEIQSMGSIAKEEQFIRWPKHSGSLAIVSNSPKTSIKDTRIFPRSRSRIGRLQEHSLEELISSKRPQCLGAQQLSLKSLTTQLRLCSPRVSPTQTI